MTQFRTAVDPQQAAVEPKDRSVVSGRGPWGERVRFKTLSSGCGTAIPRKCGSILAQRISRQLMLDKVAPST